MDANPTYGLKGGVSPKDFTGGEADQEKGERIDTVANRQGKAGRESVPERVDEALPSTGSAGLQSNVKRMLGM